MVIHNRKHSTIQYDDTPLHELYDSLGLSYKPHISEYKLIRAVDKYRDVNINKRKSKRACDEIRNISRVIVDDKRYMCCF